MNRLLPRPAAVLAVMLQVAAFLVVANVVSYCLRVGAGDPSQARYLVFDLDAERNAPTWYASMTLLCCGLVLARIACIERHQGAKCWKHWATLGATFALLGFDEALGYHEMISEPTRRALGMIPPAFAFAWVVPATAFVVVLGLSYLRFLRALPRRTAVFLVGSAVLFVSGALGVETIGGAIASTEGYGSALYFLAYTTEEALEMGGVAVFLYTLLRHAERYEHAATPLPVAPVWTTAKLPRHAKPAHPAEPERRTERGRREAPADVAV